MIITAGMDAAMNQYNKKKVSNEPSKDKPVKGASKGKKSEDKALESDKKQEKDAPVNISLPSNQESQTSLIKRIFGKKESEE